MHKPPVETQKAKRKKEVLIMLARDLLKLLYIFLSFRSKDKCMPTNQPLEEELEDYNRAKVQRISTSIIFREMEHTLLQTNVELGEPEKKMSRKQQASH